MSGIGGIHRLERDLKRWARITAGVVLALVAGALYICRRYL